MFDEAFAELHVVVGKGSGMSRLQVSFFKKKRERERKFMQMPFRKAKITAAICWGTGLLAMISCNFSAHVTDGSVDELKVAFSPPHKKSRFEI